MASFQLVCSSFFLNIPFLVQLRSPHRRGSMAPVPVSEETLRARRKVLDGRRSPRTRSPPARGRGSSDGGSLLGGSLGRFPVIETGSGITALDFTSEEPPKGLSPGALTAVVWLAWLVLIP